MSQIQTWSSNTCIQVPRFFQMKKLWDLCGNRTHTFTFPVGLVAQLEEHHTSNAKVFTIPTQIPRFFHLEKSWDLCTSATRLNLFYKLFEKCMSNDLASINLSHNCVIACIHFQDSQ